MTDPVSGFVVRVSSPSRLAAGVEGCVCRYIIYSMCVYCGV